MEIDLEKLDSEFRALYSVGPRFFRAPGRVNLIGEHTDYNDGFVMPFAIDREAVVAGRLRDDRTINVTALDIGESARIDLGSPPVKLRRSWVDYIEGTARCVADRFGTINGADIVLTSTVPIGAGLSSSAAIEIALGFALLSLNNIAIDRRELALAAQQAEHEFAGTRSGIMDQFTAVFANAGNAMLLDCRSLEIESVPVEFDATEIVVIDTKVKHDLASSAYNTRREECETGVRLLAEHIEGLTSLRDVTEADLKTYGERLPENIHRRCRHVVLENARTVEAAGEFRDRAFERAGKLMTASHVSLRDDYEVSCAELDHLVDTALAVDGVYGSRMTGGGFGGCTVNLVRKNAVEELRERSTASYVGRFGVPPGFYVFRTTDGASEITL
jgi:galactokinase